MMNFRHRNPQEFSQGIPIQRQPPAFQNNQQRPNFFSPDVTRKNNQGNMVNPVNHVVKPSSRPGMQTNNFNYVNNSYQTNGNQLIKPKSTRIVTDLPSAGQQSFNGNRNLKHQSFYHNSHSSDNLYMPHQRINPNNIQPNIQARQHLKKEQQFIKSSRSIENQNNYQTINKVKKTQFGDTKQNQISNNVTNTSQLQRKRKSQNMQYSLENRNQNDKVQSSLNSLQARRRKTVNNDQYTSNDILKLLSLGSPSNKTTQIQNKINGFETKKNFTNDYKFDNSYTKPQVTNLQSNKEKNIRNNELNFVKKSYQFKTLQKKQSEKIVYNQNHYDKSQNSEYIPQKKTIMIDDGAKKPNLPFRSLQSQSKMVNSPQKMSFQNIMTQYQTTIKDDSLKKQSNSSPQVQQPKVSVQNYYKEQKIQKQAQVIQSVQKIQDNQEIQNNQRIENNEKIENNQRIQDNQRIEQKIEQQNVFNQNNSQVSQKSQKQQTTVRNIKNIEPLQKTPVLPLISKQTVLDNQKQKIQLQAKVKKLELQKTNLQQQILGIQDKIKQAQHRQYIAYNQVALYKNKCNQLEAQVAALQKNIRGLKEYINQLQNRKNPVEHSKTFDDALKSQLEQNQKLKNQLDEQRQEIQRLNSHIYENKLKAEQAINVVAVQKLKHLTQIKQLEQKFDISLHQKDNELKTIKHAMQTLQGKLVVAVNQNKTKDSFLTQFLVGRSKTQSDKQMIKQILNSYRVQFSVDRIGQKILQQQKLIQQLQMKLQSMNHNS